MKRTLILFIFFGLVFSNCQQKEARESSKTDDIPVKDFAMASNERLNNDIVEQLCFLDIRQNDPVRVKDKIIQMTDTIFISLEIYEDNRVKGVFNRFPPKNEGDLSTFEGIIKEDIIDAIRSYPSFGIQIKEEIQFELGTGEITQKYGDFEEKDGVYTLKDKNNLQRMQAILQADCDVKFSSK